MWWDPAEVRGSGRALLAADETGVIVAVSHSAAQFLGYEHATDLVGNRLTHIVPLRYHQAHIAGLTLHMINGRSPLLGHQVTVPVIRADGSDVLVGLIVQPHPLPGNHRPFIAEFATDDPGGNDLT